MSGWQPALHSWLETPHKFGNALGFSKLSEIHSVWIKYFIQNPGRRSLQAHRNSYKTTSGLVALTLLFMVFPNLRVLIVRKSGEMASELLQALDQIWHHPLVLSWYYSRYGITDLKTDVWNRSAMTLVTKQKITAEPSVRAAGIGKMRTGNHFDLIWPDDIVTSEDRYSRAERIRTANTVYELENIVEPTGAIFFSGTPWHPQDMWSLTVVPKPEQYPIGSIPVIGIDENWIANRKETTPKSLWIANYELRHVADVDPQFSDAVYQDFPEVKNAHKLMYVDPAFGGKDGVAAFAGYRVDDTFYVTYGKLWQKHIADCYHEIVADFWTQECAKLYCESNGAQVLAVEEFDRLGVPVHEGGVKNTGNKFARITGTLKPVWKRIVFHESLKPIPGKHEFIDGKYIPLPMEQVLEYNADAENDDAPDALAGLVAALLGEVGDLTSDFLDIQKSLQ